MTIIHTIINPLQYYLQYTIQLLRLLNFFLMFNVSLHVMLAADIIVLLFTQFLRLLRVGRIPKLRRIVRDQAEVLLYQPLCEN